MISTSPWRTYCEIAWRSFWVTFIFVGLSTALIEQTETGLPLTSLGFIALGCLLYSLFASAPFGVAAWIGQRGKNKVERTFPRLQRALEFCAILFFAIAIFAPAPFGELDGGERIRLYPFSLYLWDWFRFLGMSVLVFFLFRYALRKNFPLFRWVCVLAVAFAVYACASKDFFRTAVEREARQVELRQMELGNLGSEKNIIVIVIDSLQGGIAEIALREEALREEYDDFTLFRLGVGPATLTKYVVPVLLSGSSGQDSLRLSKDYLAEDTFFHDARQAGYENRIFSFGISGLYPHCAAFNPYQIPIFQIDETYAVQLTWLESQLEQATQTVLFGAYKNFPIVISHSLIRKRERILRRIFGLQSSFTYWRLAERAFLHGMATWEISSEKNSLIFHHNSSFHTPLQFDRQGNITTPATQRSGEYVIGSAAYHLEMLLALFRNLKEKGLWDDSLVIIIGDHGHRFGNEKDGIFADYPEIQKKLPSGAEPSSYHPVFLIKFPHQQHSLELSNIPIALSDIRGLIDQYVHDNDWTNVNPRVLDIPLDRENEIYLNQNEIHFSKRLTFRGGADAIPAAIEKYERERKK